MIFAIQFECNQTQANYKSQFMFLQMNIRGNIVQFSGPAECKALKPENKMLSASHPDALHQCTHFHLKLYRSINGWTFLKNPGKKATWFLSCF